MDYKQTIDQLYDLKTYCEEKAIDGVDTWEADALGLNLAIKALEKLQEYENINSSPKALLKEVQKHRVNEIKNKRIFKWVKCKRKNGNEFLKLIYFRYESDGWVEAGRFNMTKSECVNNEWTLDEILAELN